MFRRVFEPVQHARNVSAVGLLQETFFGIPNGYITCKCLHRSAKTAFIANRCIIINCPVLGLYTMFIVTLCADTTIVAWNSLPGFAYRFVETAPTQPTEPNNNFALAMQPITQVDKANREIVYVEMPCTGIFLETAPGVSVNLQKNTYCYTIYILYI